MKVLLDENLDFRLRQALGQHEVLTVAFLGWQGRRNGKLLSLAEAAAFEVLVTADQNMRFQQNLEDRRLALVILTAQHWRAVERFIPEIARAVEAAIAGSITVVECR